MKITLRTFTLLAFLMFASQTLEAFPLWGDLQAGSFKVGYKVILTHDLSRPPLVGPGDTVNPIRGRQMQISVWYPAQSPRHASYMPFEQYVFLKSLELDFSALTDVKKQHAKQEFMADPLARGASADKLAALMGVRTAAIKNAPEANGDFPLVIFAHSSPPNQSIMCEYLASHGFIVAAVPSKGSFEYAFDVGLSGLETLIRDMEFVLSSAKQLPHVDATRLGLIGMSFGSAAVIGFHTRHPEVRAMISLDGGIGEGGVGFLVTRTPFFETSRLRAPLLHLYTPNNPHLDLNSLESYRYSTRYLVNIPRMRHGDFGGYGMLEQFVPKILGESPGDTKTGFEWVCRYTLNFLEASLNNDARGLTFLQRAAELNGAPKELLSVTVKASLQAPPLTRELQALLESGGIERLTAFYAARKVQDAQPFTHSSFLSLNELFLGRKNYESAKQLGLLFVESYPNSVRSHLALANAAEQSGDRELARNQFLQALTLINDDPNLDYRARKGLEQTARQGLLRLK